MAERASPTVLILGGFLTAPPLYLPFAARLRERGAAGVVVANVWTPDWMLGAIRGNGPLTTRSGFALKRAITMSAERSEGLPVLVVGHSAGGITARLLTAPEPFPGRRFGAAAHIAAIVTLGTPHRLASGAGIGRRLNEVAADVATRCVPGAFHSPLISYLSIASSAVAGDPRGNARSRLAHLMYRSVIGRAAVPGTEGDGVVPVSATHLEGAREILLRGYVHSPTAGRSWYGSPDALEAWWPVALEAWRGALECRSGASTSESAGSNPIASRGGPV